MNLLTFALLYASVVSFITIWFQYVNFLYPDINHYYPSILDGIRWATSILVVVFPVFVLLSWMLGREFKSQPDKRETWVRRWLVYLTLFVSAVTIIVDLITLVYNFFNGELTSSFFLKVLVILIVAVAVFGYYMWDLRRKDFKSKKPKVFAWISGTVIIASVVLSFVLMGSPSTQRDRRFDERRISDLQIIQNQVLQYWISGGVLSPKLVDLGKNDPNFVLPKDPQSDTEYEYHILTGDQPTFELCAIFKQPSINNMRRQQVLEKPIAPYRDGAYFYPYQNNWEHGVGRQCFKQVIDPAVYKRLISQ